MQRILVFFLLVHISCKTIEVPEHQVFWKGPYDYHRIEQYVAGSAMQEEDKAWLMAFARSVIQADDTIVARKGDVTLHRRFLRIDDSVALEYFVFQPVDATQAGVFFHGSSLNIFTFYDRFFDLAARTNARIYLPHYRGYGKSDGTPSYTTQFADNQYFLEQVALKEGPVDFVMGYSLGTTFATYLAVDNAIAELILFAPISNARQAARIYKRQQTIGWKCLARPFLKVEYEPHIMTLSNSDKIQNYRGALTIFHGTKDQRLPVRVGKYVYRKAGTSKKTFVPIENGAHSSPFLPENWEMVVERLKPAEQAER